MMRALFLLVLAACAAPAPVATAAPLPYVADCSPDDPRNPSKVWTAMATAVIDGDSFCMGEVEIRTRRYDAPEWNEPGGPEARERLRDILSASGPLTCEGFARSYDRIIAACTLSDGRGLDKALKEAAP